MQKNRTSPTKYVVDFNEDIYEIDVWTYVYIRVVGLMGTDLLSDEDFFTVFKEIISIFNENSELLSPVVLKLLLDDYESDEFDQTASDVMTKTLNILLEKERKGTVSLNSFQRMFIKKMLSDEDMVGEFIYALIDGAKTMGYEPPPFQKRRLN